MGQLADADSKLYPLTQSQTQAHLSLLNSAFTYFPAAALLIDEYARFHSVSDKACQLLGYSRTELLQLEAADIHPDWSAELWQQRWQAFKTSGAINFNAEYKTRDGRTFPVQVNARFFMHEGQNYQLAVVTDVSETKQAAAATGNQNDLISAMIQAIPDPVWVKNLEGVYLACNAAVGRIYNDHEVNIVGKTDYDYVSPELADFFRQKDQETIAAGRTCINEEWVSCPSHGLRAMETIKTPLHDGQGRIIGVLGIARDITAHKQLEEELRAKEQYQRALLDNFPFMVWLKDTESRFLSVNRAFADIAGVDSVDMLYGRTDLDFFPQDLAELYRADDQAVMHSGQKKVVQEPIESKQNRRLFETYKAPVLDADGKLLGTVGFAQDITERQAAQHLLQLLTHALDKVEATVLLMGENDPYFIYANQTAALSLGYSCQELTMGMGVPHIDPHWSWEACEKIWPILFERRTITFESEHRTKNGRLFPVETTCNVFEFDGKIYNLAICRDISERKLTEKSLRKSEQEFRTLAENSPDVIVRYDRECLCIYANPAYELANGVTAEQALGKQPIEILPALEPIAAIYQKEIKHVLQTGIALRTENEWQMPDGAYKAQSLSAVPEYDQHGKIISVLAISRDITKLKATQHKLEESRAQLQALTANRETAREEERKRIAREIHDELGQLLNVLRLNVSTLDYRYGNDNADLRYKTQNMAKVVDQAIDIVCNLATRLRPAVLEGGIGMALEWLVQAFSRNTGIDCKLEIPEEEIDFDEDRAMVVFRIVQESLTNILRHSGADQIEIELYQEDKDLMVKIQDNGCGFVPGKAGRKDSFGIVGMQERMMMLGGVLEIISAPGQGASVQLRIPI